jgi:hypothetical protein
MYDTIEFASEFIANLEVCPNSRVEGLVIRKGELFRARIKPYVAETADGPVEVADLFLDDGTPTFQVPLLVSDLSTERGQIMQVGEQFAKDLVTAGPDDSLTSVARLMEQHNVGTVVIVQNQKPIGIVTDRDLALVLGAREFPPQTPAGQVMTVPVTTIDQRKEVADATWYMLGYEVRRLPIVDEKGRLVAS